MRKKNGLKANSETRKLPETAFLFPEEPFEGLRLRYSSFRLECGCDEAGRGCLAGPVVAAAVILPDDFRCAELNDSKQLSQARREALRPRIEAEAWAWAVAFVDNLEIDRINILNASIQAMHRAIDALALEPEFIIVDGNRFKAYRQIPHQTLVKGDARYASIAAASVLAKTHRDEYMSRLHADYPQYEWQQNKAYPTRQHREAIKRFGISPYHRLSFRL